jgi:hypothetical protein
MPPGLATAGSIFFLYEAPGYTCDTLDVYEPQQLEELIRWTSQSRSAKSILNQ